MDLMYFGYDFPDERSMNKKAQADFISEVKAKFPDVVLNNAYDSIKGFRQDVRLPKERKDDYYAWLIAHGWFNLSLSVNLIMMDEKQKDEANRLVALAKSQYPDNFIKEEKNNADA